MNKYDVLINFLNYKCLLDVMKNKIALHKYLSHNSQAKYVFRKVSVRQILK